MYVRENVRFMTIYERNVTLCQTVGQRTCLASCKVGINQKTKSNQSPTGFAQMSQVMETKSFMAAHFQKSHIPYPDTLIPRPQSSIREKVGS